MNAVTWPVCDVYLQVIDIEDRYLDDVTSNYTLLAPSNVAVQKMFNFTSAQFWKDDGNVLVFFRCVMFWLVLQ